MIGRRIDIRGTVQGVGFRPWVYRLAHELGVYGRVKNDPRGVTIEAFADDLGPFIARLQHDGPPASHVEDLFMREIPVENLDDFVIVGSDRAGDKRLTIPPDRRLRPPATVCGDMGDGIEVEVAECVHCTLGTLPRPSVKKGGG